MAVQILDTLGDSNAELRATATADLSKQLLALYSPRHSEALELDVFELHLLQRRGCWARREACYSTPTTTPGPETARIGLCRLGPKQPVLDDEYSTTQTRPG